jgi:hypothetical protein
MNGIQLLAITREQYPETVRVLLTGAADLKSAIEAVNEGYIFRFLTKLCTRQTLIRAVTAAVTQHELIVAERELQDKTLRGCIEILGEFLALANPTAFGRSVRVQRLIKGLAKWIPGAGAWEVEVAVVLSQLVYLAVSELSLTAAVRGAHLPLERTSQIETHARNTLELLRRIPRLERVTEIIAYLNKPFDAPPQADLELAGKELPLGARLLRIGFDFDDLLSRGLSERQAIAHLDSKSSSYDPDVFSALRRMIEWESGAESRDVSVGELSRGMLMAEDVFSDTGVLLLGRGHPVTEAVSHRLQSLAEKGASPKRVRVTIPPRRGLPSDATVPKLEENLSRCRKA